VITRAPAACARYRRGDEGLGIGGSDHDRIDAAGDYLLDEVHRLGEFSFVFDAVEDEFVLGGMRG